MNRQIRQSFVLYGGQYVCIYYYNTYICTVGAKKVNICDCNYSVIENYCTLYLLVITIVL